MRRTDAQPNAGFPSALRLVNAPDPMMPNLTKPDRFSDACADAPYGAVDPTDPRHLLAVMVQTRRQCRASGLIKRDCTELIEIGRHLGISAKSTREIISLMNDSDPESDLLNQHFESLALIPMDSPQKKTRIPIQVFLGVLIWALTIVVAMQMV